MITTINNNWIFIIRRVKDFQNPDGTHKIVTIREYLNPLSLTRVVDPQSGSCLKGCCRYVVMTENPRGNLVTNIQEMSMEELYDSHPWFFGE